MPQTILVVDDDVETQRYLSLLLGNQGYQVVGSGEGREALKLATDNPPDMCIVDVMMPGMDGFDLTRQLRSHPKTSALPILLFSARTRDEDVREGFAAGADEYLTKPARPADIKRVVTALFEENRNLEETRRAYVLGVVGVRNGLGASTLALNIGAAHARDNKRMAIAVEMQPGASNWRQELNISESANLQELFKLNAISTGALNRAMNRTAFGLRVLLAGEGEALDRDGDIAKRYESLIKKLARDMDLVVLDIGKPRLPEFPAILDQLDGLLVVTGPDDKTLVNTGQFIDYLRNHGFGSCVPMEVIVNRVAAGADFDVAQAEAWLLHSVRVVMTQDDELITRARVSFRPAYMVQSEAQFSRRIDELNRRIAAHIQMRKY